MRVFTDEERQLIRDTVFPPELGDRDFDRFMYFCSVRDLNPIEGHCYAQARKNKDTGKYTMSIQTGIDGLRLIADRTGLYAGNDDYEYGPLEGGKPSWARAVVYKVLSGGQLGKFAATARWAEYKPKFNDHMWQAMPHNQLGKCAEALALRKGFPGPLGNIHTDDEMAQADDSDLTVTEQERVERPVAKPVTEHKPEAKPTASPKPAAAPAAKAAGALDREAAITRITKLCNKMSELTGGKRYNPFHLTNHLKTHYKVDALDKMADDQLIAFGKELVAEVTATEAELAEEAEALRQAHELMGLMAEEPA